MTTSLAGYPISVGDKQKGVYDHVGPASYQTGGESVPANDFGMSSIDFVLMSAYSLSGNYIVIALYQTAQNVGSVVLTWYQTATGIQPPGGTNLSGEHVRMEVIGV
jgi:hypothetical protein